MASASLQEAFVAALPDDARAAFADFAGLDDKLASMVREAREAASSLSPSAEQFVAHIARVLGKAPEPESLEGLKVADLYLACACALGDRHALNAFDREFGRDIDLAIARSGNVNLTKDEFRQALRNKLFVARDARPPKIADYAGRGDLRAWVRVTAVRMIVDIVRSKNADKEIPVEAEMLGAMPSPAEDPELDYIQRTYKTEFKEALSDGFANLTPRERNLLRHQVIHGLNIDQVGAIYNVHRTTAFRWIEKARKALLHATKEALMQRLKVGQSQFLSIMRVVQSDLDLSMRRLLVSDIEDEPGG
ncbi:MAG: sigma-70 family RNA polymerase sigma factor [Myxococcota bacterium]